MEMNSNNQLIDLSPAEKQIEALLQKSGFYLQKYRAIDAMTVLNIAQETGPMLLCFAKLNSSDGNPI